MELTRAVARLPEQHVARCGCPLDQQVVVGQLTGERANRLRRSRDQRAARPLQQVAHLRVSGLREVLIPQADGAQPLRSAQADDIVGISAERAADVGIGVRDCDEDPLEVVQPDRWNGGQHRRPSRPAVIDDDHGPAGEVRQWSIAPVGAFTALGSRRSFASMHRSIPRDGGCSRPAFSETRMPPVEIAPNAYSS